MIRYNKDKLPKLLVQGQVWHSSFNVNGKTGIDGHVDFLPGTGGITYNVKIGDSAIGWAADHLEPGVSSKNQDPYKNDAYITYSCIGNKAVVASGDAKGKCGFVTGKHGGCNHLMIYFPEEALNLLSIDDKINVYSQGQGIKLLDYENIAVRNTSPELLEKMNILEKDGKLNVGVSKIVPACIMGSGIGSVPIYGDYDITLFDKKINEEYDLYNLRLGDIVAIIDADTRYGRTYLKGAVTIGVVIHSDCIIPGHGPGVTTLMSSKDSIITPFIDENANLASIFNIEK